MVRLLSLLVLAALSGSAAAVVHTFDADNQGWATFDFDEDAGTFAFFAAAGYSADGGNPGGSLLTSDVAPYCFLGAPAAFLGNQSTAFGGDLTFDTKTTSADGAAYPAVVLASGTTLLYGFAPVPGMGWTGVSIPLVGASWTTALGAPVSDATLKGVLSNLTGLYVQADWDLNTQAEQTGLDNVRLPSNPVPEPASLAALALGLAALRRRRA